MTSRTNPDHAHWPSGPEQRFGSCPSGIVLDVEALSGFMMLEFPDKPSLVYREDPTGGVFFDDPTEVKAHQHILDRLDAIALDDCGSMDLFQLTRSKP